jgi:hypothetical protein
MQLGCAQITTKATRYRPGQSLFSISLMYCKPSGDSRTLGRMRISSCQRRMHNQVGCGSTTRRKPVWYSSHALVFIAVVFHFQYSFYLEVIVFCPFRTQVLFPMSSGNAPGLFNQTDQTWMATCISILQSNGLRNGTAFSGLVDGTGQAMTTFSDNTWGINLSTCYKYCNASAIPLV